MASVIGNASISYVDSSISTTKNTLLSNDSGKITTDGNGNVTISGNLTVTGSLSATTTTSVTGIVEPTSFKFPTSTFANLPTTPSAGDSYLVSNGLKPGETTGNGTGVLSVYDGTNWLSVSSGTTIQT